MILFTVCCTGRWRREPQVVPGGFEPLPLDEVKLHFGQLVEQGENDHLVQPIILLLATSKLEETLGSMLNLAIWINLKFKQMNVSMTKYSSKTITQM